MLNKLLRILGTLLLCSDLAFIASLLAGIVLLMSGHESILEQATPLIFGLLVFSMAGRIVAGIHVLLDSELTVSDRFDACGRYVFQTGFSASRYLKNLDRD